MESPTSKLNTPPPEKIYLYWNDDRHCSTKLLTNRLAEALSDNNLAHFSARAYPCLHANKQILTILVHGMPPNSKEFQGFVFPGKTVTYFTPGLELQAMPDQHHIKRLQNLSEESVVRQIDEIVQSHGGKVVFVAHSFGTYISTLYISKHPSKVVGMVDFGGIPMRIYQALKIYGDPYVFGIGDQMSFDYALKNYEFIYRRYLEQAVKAGSVAQVTTNKYKLIGFYMMLNSKLFKHIFEDRRRFPSTLLKMITYGRRDRVFQPELMNQYAIHYTYDPQGSLEHNTNQRLSKEFQQVTGVPTDNIQSRFILSYPRTGHGIHLVRKRELQNMMNLYFSLVLKDIPDTPKI